MLNQEEYDRIARSDCFVCRIVAGKPLIANVQIVYEDDQVIAFLNQFPTQEGYTIVCPKRHVERFESDLSVEEWLHLQTVVQPGRAGTANRGDREDERLRSGFGLCFHSGLELLCRLWSPGVVERFDFAALDDEFPDAIQRGDAEFAEIVEGNRAHPANDVPFHDEADGFQVEVAIGESLLPLTDRIGRLESSAALVPDNRIGGERRHRLLYVVRVFSVDQRSDDDPGLKGGERLRRKGEIEGFDFVVGDDDFPIAAHRRNSQVAESIE